MEQERGGLAEMPDEILLLIFHHLDHLSLNTSRLVNKQWHHCASDNHLFVSPPLPPLYTALCFSELGSNQRM